MIKNPLRMLFRKMFVSITKDLNELRVILDGCGDNERAKEIMEISEMVSQIGEEVLDEIGSK